MVKNLGSKCRDFVEDRGFFMIFIIVWESVWSGIGLLMGMLM